MSIVDQLKWSLRHSKRQALESILVTLAIGLGIGVIITVLAMFWSVAEEYRKLEELDYFRSLQIVSRAEEAQRQLAPIALVSTDPTGISWSAPLDEVLELQKLLPSMHVYVELSWLAYTNLLPQDENKEEDIWYGFRGNEIFLTGTLPSYFAFSRARVQQGSIFLLDDVRSASRVLVITETLARDLFGDEDPIGRTVPLSFDDSEAVDFTVIGVLAAPDDTDSYSLFADNRMAWAPVTVIPSYRSGPDDTTHFYNISVGLDPGVDLASALEQVRRECELLWGEDSIAVGNPLESWRESMKHMQRYAFIIGLLASVGLVIAVINILNLMLARVLKRTKSIGLSMALGSSRRQVFRQFMMEALFLGLVGALVGILLSSGFAVLLERGYGAFAAGKGGARVGLGIVMGFLVSLLFGVYPAYLGSRTNPVDALRID